MKKIYLSISRLVVFIFTLVCIGPKAFAQDLVKVSNEIKAVQVNRVFVETELGIDLSLDTYQHARSYYDDLEDHYEQDQLMRDVIAKGI